jgi:hypothetical protein
LTYGTEAKARSVVGLRQKEVAMKGHAARIRFDRTWRHGSLGLLLIAFVLPEPLSAGESTNPTAAQRLVDEALLAEVAGDSAQRATLLREALYFAPNLQAARWHSGQIQIGDQWQTVEDAQKAAAADSVIAEYRALREKLGDSGEGQLELARWCRRNNLDQEARVHWSNVLAVQPRNEEAQRALGMRWFADRLRTHAEIKEIKAERRAAREAAERWASQIAKWNRALSGSDAAAKDAALGEIRALKDPDVIPAIEGETLGGRLTSVRDIEKCRQLSLAFMEALDQMPDHVATQSLIRHAVFSEIPEARDAAIADLKQHSLHDFVPLLLSGLEMPIETSFHVSTNRDGSVHYFHSLYREGPEMDWKYDTRLSAVQINLGGRWHLRDVDTGKVELGPHTESGVTLAPKKAAVAAAYQNRYGNAIVSTEQRVRNMNKATEARNMAIITALRALTGSNLGDSPVAWWDWWREKNEYYASEERPVEENYYSGTDSYYYGQPRYGRRSSRPKPTGGKYQITFHTKDNPIIRLPPGMHCCFASGTKIWTKTGLQSIEILELGDLVLSKNVDTGELCFKPIIGVVLRPSSRLIRLSLGREAILTSAGHPMWVSGAAWQMAKELKTGAILHGVEGPVTIEQIDSADEAEAYNLIVADFSTYFVGESGILVHDNTPRKPTLAKVPGLVAAE